jgi:L-ascorbate metabolism protein UlaG (beta-lactamase superfamily)
MKSTLPWLSRRVWIGAAAVGATAAVAEGLALAGYLDHRTAAPVNDASHWKLIIARIEHLGSEFTGVVHIGHATHLLVVAGRRVLTDPWFYEPAWGGLRHAQGPALFAEGVGPLDAIVISHQHPDHFDPQALDRLDKSAAVFVPTERLRTAVQQLGFAATEVVRPWERVPVGEAWLEAVPAVHGVEALGFVLGRAASEGRRRAIYFAGDTRLSAAMAEIADRLAPSLAIVPVGEYRLIGGPPQVMTPLQAVEATRKLRVTDVIPTHTDAVFQHRLAGPFVVAPSPAAPDEFESELQRRLPSVHCHRLAPGQFLRHG